jgi:hypothetical protein
MLAPQFALRSIIVGFGPIWTDPGGLANRKTGNANIKSGKGLRHINEPLPTPCPHLAPATPDSPSDLAAVVNAWPDLPEALRAGIVAMVQASLGHTDSPENTGNRRRPRKGGGR